MVLDNFDLAVLKVIMEKEFSNEQDTINAMLEFNNKKIKPFDYNPYYCRTKINQSIQKLITKGLIYRETHGIYISLKVSKENLINLIESLNRFDLSEELESYSSYIPISSDISSELYKCREEFYKGSFLAVLIRCRRINESLRLKLKEKLGLKNNKGGALLAEFYENTKRTDNEYLASGLNFVYKISCQEAAHISQDRNEDIDKTKAILCIVLTNLLVKEIFTKIINKNE